VPGDSCVTPGVITNSFIWAGGPQNGGVTNGMFCNGTTWTGAINFQSSGHVGIGTTTPATKLDVNGTIRFAYGGEACAAGTIGGLYYSSATHLMYGCLTAGSWTQIGSAGAVTAAGATTQVQFNSGGNLGASANYTWNNGTQVLTIAGSGSVTNATSGGTAVTGAANTGAGVGIEGTTSSTTAAANGVYGLASGASGATYGVYGSDGSATGFGGYFTNTNGGYALVTNAGNVGIGTTSPAYQLEVDTSGTTAVHGTTSSTTSQAAGVQGYATGATGATHGVYGQTASTTTNAVGVFGRGAGATGATYGVYGDDASATGFGGYFTNTNGGYALATGSGNVGIGTTTPGFPLDIYQQSTVTSGSPGGSQSYIRANPAATSTAWYTGLNAIADTTGSQSLSGGRIYGLISRATHTGTATLDNANGLMGWLQNTSTGTITNANSIITGFDNNGAGTISNGYGIQIAAPTNGGGGTITNYYGLYVARPTVAATNYAIYSAGGTNYFGGNVGIGTASPGSLLDIGLAGTTRGTLRLEGSASGYVQIQPAVAAGSVTFTLPATVGTAGQQLTTDGASPATLSWAAAGSGGPLSGLTAATAGNTIANAANAQVWNWDTLTTGTALTIGSTSMTTGYLLSLQNTNAASAVGEVLNVTNAQVGGVAASIGETATTGATTGVYGSVASTNNGAIAVQGDNTAATGGGYGGYFSSASTGAATGVYGEETGAGNTGYGGYFANTSATGATYGVYGTDASATGFGGYFTNTNGGYAAAFMGGNVGIGTTTPAQALEVNGEIKVDTFASASATTVCSNANVLSTCSSSIRYKEKVKDAPFGLKDVMKMRPVTFKWKGRDENDLGFIAEEMEKVNPLFVNYARGQIEGVKYPQLTAVLANAVKEQQAQIDSLKALNDKLEAMNDHLKAANDNIEARLKVLEAAARSK
jgi:hypothetical protein